VAAIFCGSDPASFSFRPYGSGYLNPVLGALALLGLARALLRYRSDSARFLLMALALGLAPAFLTRLTEYFRMAHVIPFILLSALVGLELLLEATTPVRRTAAALCMMAISIPCDLAHLVRVREHGGRLEAPWTNRSRSQSRAHAYSFLAELKRQNGPGLLLDNLAPQPADQSLSLAVHSWNVPLETGKTAWAAIYLELAFANGLKSHDPEGHVIPLWGNSPSESPMALYVRVCKGPCPTWIWRWENADRAFESVVRETIAHKEGRGRTRILRAMMDSATTFNGDRILTSLYWLRVSDYYRVQNAAGYYRPEILGPGDSKLLRGNLLNEEIRSLSRSISAYPIESSEKRLSELLVIQKLLEPIR
jgi:hypothetical protein